MRGGLARFFPHCAALHGGLRVVLRGGIEGQNLIYLPKNLNWLMLRHLIKILEMRMGMKWGKAGLKVILLPLLLIVVTAGAQPAGPDLARLIQEAQAAIDRRDFKHAKVLSEQALALAGQLPGAADAQVGDALTLSGQAESALGNHKTAQALLLRAVAIAESNSGTEHLQTAVALHYLAETHSALAQHQQALQINQRVIAIRERAFGPFHLDVAASLNNLAMNQAAMTHYAEAQALHQRALAIREKLLPPGDPLIAVSLHNLAAVLYQTGQYGKASQLLQQALAFREKALAPEDPLIATSLSNLALVETALGMPDKALPLRLRALAIQEKTRGPEHPDTAALLNNLADNYAVLGRRDLALPLQLRSLSIHEKTLGPSHPATATSLNNLASTYGAMASFDKALPLQQRAAAIFEQTLGPEHLNLAGSLSNLATTYTRMGQFDKALPIRLRALAIYEKTLGPAHPNTAQMLNNLAQTHIALGQDALAVPLLERALAIREKALGPEHPGVAAILNNLAAAHLAGGHQEQALPLQQRALAIREKSLGAWHTDLAASLQTMAQIDVALGLPEQAMPLQQRALSIYQHSSGPAHPNTALALASLAAMHLALNDRPFAIALLKQAVNNYQAMREQAAGIGSTELRSYTDSVASTYQRLASALTDAGRLPEAQMVLDMLKEDEQFDFIRRSATPDPGRTRIGYNPTEQGWMSRYQEISGQIAAIGAEQQGLLKLGKQGLSAEKKQRQLTLVADLKVAQAAFDAFMTAMREDFARLGPARQVELAESSVKALADLRSMLAGLGQGSLLLQIYLSEDQVNLLLTGPGVQLARSSKVSAKDLNRQIAAFRRLLRDPKSDPLPAAQALYQLLIAPVAKDLEQAGARTVMLSLDGALRYLPFGALHDGRRYLAQRWNLPLYTSVARERLRDAVAPQWQAAGLGVTRQLGEFAPLPGVEAEIRGIVRGGNGGKAADKSAALAGEVYLDGAFTAQRLKDVSQRQFPVLHIASHFRFSPGTEVNSFLLLGDGQQLTLGDIRLQNYRFDHVDLLTLSACDTGLGGGRDEQGREIEGFGVIAQQQGARAVLATLWPVADQSTAALMADMYRKRQTLQLSKIEALRQAQLALQAQPRYQHPFYWAPFILMGNWK